MTTAAVDMHHLILTEALEGLPAPRLEARTDAVDAFLTYVLEVVSGLPCDSNQCSGRFFINFSSTHSLS